MTKIFLAIALVTTTALGGCAGLTQANLAAQVSAVEAEVQADANLVCGFIPTIATVAAFIPGAGTVAPAAASIAEAICGAIAQAPPVTAQSARLNSLKSGMAVNVATVKNLHGDLVPISGTFTK